MIRFGWEEKLSDNEIKVFKLGRQGVYDLVLRSSSLKSTIKGEWIGRDKMNQVSET